MRTLGLALAMTCAALPLRAQDQPVIITSYHCDRGVTVPATYFDFGDYMYVVLHAEGQQITLIRQRGSMDERYGWDIDGFSKGPTYIWVIKGRFATLYWKEGGAETPLLTCPLDE